MTPTQKRVLLSRLSHLMDICGYDNTELFGHPLSYFNFDNIKETITKYEKTEASMNGQTYEEYKTLRND